MASKRLPAGDCGLCDRCYRMTGSIEGLRALTSTKGYTHHGGPALLLSANGGCPFCLMILEDEDIVEDIKDREPLQFFTAQLDAYAQKVPGQESVAYPLSGLSFNTIIGRNSGNFGVEVLPFAASEDPSAKYVSNRPIIRDIDTESVYQTLRQWISECRHEHKACSNQTRFRPSRLINTKTSVNGNSVRLQISHGDHSEEYAALSYCWGRSMSTALTTTKNIAERMNAIQCETLPKTLQDAISITRSLGLNLLWIDALCILQDDDTDKAKEINAMGSIYKNASVTIAAGSATDSNEGFLSARSPPVKYCQMPILLPDGKYGSISVTRQVYGWLPHNPLDSRGWTFQESWLSTRVIFYGKDELQWHCKTEQFKKLTPHCLNNSVRSITSKPSESRIGILQSEVPSRAYQHDFWCDIVEEYSRRLVSFSSDRLPAIGGIAQEISTTWAGVYIAGSWKLNFVQQLAWFRPPNTKDPEAQSANGCPTWSWASLSQPIKFLYSTVPIAKLQDARIEPLRPENPFGQIKNGHIIIQGKMARKISTFRARFFHFDRDMYRNKGDLYYLLLGYNQATHDQAGFDQVALMLYPSGSGSYMRVGIARRCDRSAWDGVAEEAVMIC